LLSTKLKPVPEVEHVLLASLISRLEDKRFVVREKASKQLHGLGALVVPSLQRTLATNPSLEMRLRIERLLALERTAIPAPDLLQAIRAVQILEQIGSAEARQVLIRLAQGAPEARLTQVAMAARTRLAHRTWIKASVVPSSLSSPGIHQKK